MLQICENEFISNRGYLVSQFLSEYCEEEMEEYSNYSDKKLSNILGVVTGSDSDISEEPQYDLCEKLIAKNILTQRGGE